MGLVHQPTTQAQTLPAVWPQCPRVQGRALGHTMREKCATYALPTSGTHRSHYPRRPGKRPDDIYLDEAFFTDDDPDAPAFEPPSERSEFIQELIDKFGPIYEEPASDEGSASEQKSSYADANTIDVQSTDVPEGTVNKDERAYRFTKRGVDDGLFTSKPPDEVDVNRYGTPIAEFTDDMYDDWDPEDPVSPFENFTPSCYVSYNMRKPFLRHEVSVTVDKSASICYQLFDDHMSWGSWFSLIHRFAIDPEDNSKVELYCYYKWGPTVPALELYIPLQRTDFKKDVYIKEETADGFDGFPLKGEVHFEKLKPQTTKVTLKLQYALIEQLEEFVGQVAVWGNVNDHLEECMQSFKLAAENFDVGALVQRNQEDRELLMRVDWNDPSTWPPEDRRAGLVGREPVSNPNMRSKSETKGFAAAGAGAAAPSGGKKSTGGRKGGRGKKAK